MSIRYRDRTDAGRAVAARLADHAGRGDVLVLALPRGGVPVARGVARALEPRSTSSSSASSACRAARSWPWGRSPPPACGCSTTKSCSVCIGAGHRPGRGRRTPGSNAANGNTTAAGPARGRGPHRDLVDDGLATGASMRAAVVALRRRDRPDRRRRADRLPATCREFRDLVDQVVCADPSPSTPSATGTWTFRRRTMTRSVNCSRVPREAEGSPMKEDERMAAAGRPVRVSAGSAVLEGDLTVPAGAVGVVLFAHGSGSSRQSPRNRFVAGVLHEGGLATLRIDLLTPEEEKVDLRTARLRFDIGRLAERLVHATDWLGRAPETRGLRVGYFGASTGGGAALVAAAERPDPVGAVVSRGGRPDLAGPSLPRVRAPTLLIVGGDDGPVIDMNRTSMTRMCAETVLEIIPGASHLFEEPGTLDEVARLARLWFDHHLTPARGASEPRPCPDATP
ncbi:MAG: dienelactone hydrolase family protein [Singulisphaera sp.]